RAPGATGDVMNHQNGHAAQRDTEPEQVRHQIRPEELLGAAECPNSAEPESRNTGNQCATLHAVENVLGSKRGRRSGPVHGSFAGGSSRCGWAGPRSSWARLAGGTSASPACWLSCSARTYATIAHRSFTAICCA